MKYQSGEVLIQEKRREDRIRALGFIVVRWTWDDIIRHSQEVAAQIWRASRLATRRAI
jgi:very-short-patch-repair endonuclease